MPLEAGARLGHYEIVSPAGAGGMGEVYKARDTRLDRLVAVKVLPSHLAEDDALRERFEREAKAISALNHPNVCTLHEFASEGDVDYLVMEYLEGETLAERLKKGALPLGDALTIGGQIAQALDKAHRHGVVHRDLKPANVMLTKTGAKLLDFGLAKHAATNEASEGDLSALPTAAKELTAKGAILGTFQYMAPEQLEGEAVSPQTDIFALGLVLFEMVTGQKAFEGKSQASLISAIMSSEPPALSTLQPVSPPSLDGIVATCLAKAPVDRWASAGDVARQLGLVTRGDARSVMPAPKKAAGAPLALAAVLGLAIGALAFWSIGAGTTPGNALRHLSITVPSDTPLRGNIEISRDGKNIVFVAAVGRGYGLYRRALDERASVLVPGGVGSGSLAFSPDGRSVGFRGGDGYKKVALAGGTPISVSDLFVGGGASWGASGRFALGVEDGIYVVSENGGEPTRLTEQEDPGSVPQWLPGDKQLLIVSNRGLEILDVESRTRTFLLEGDSPRYARSGHILFAKETTLWAVPFDIETLSLAGDAVPVLENVERRRGYTSYAIDDAGTLVFLPRTGSAVRSLVWVDRRGRSTPIDAVAADDYYNPRLSPDDTRVALSTGVESSSEVWVLDLANGGRRPVAVDGPNGQPGWSSDGRHVLYTSSQPTGGYRLFRVPDGGSTAAEPLALNVDAWQWDVSPDAGRVAFNDFSMTADVKLWSESGDVESLVEPSSPAVAPRFDPTGKYLSYIAMESKGPMVYVIALDTRETWRISTDVGVQAVWSRDGTELFFRRRGEMWSAAISREPEFAPGTPRLLFEGAYSNVTSDGTFRSINYDVASDGRFLMLESTVEGQITEIGVIQGFHDELERLAPREP